MENNARKDYDRLIGICGNASCLLFFIAHALYLLFFLVIGVYEIVYINIGSLIIYSILFLVLKYRLYNLYVIVAALEISGFMTICSIFLGIETGFSLCLVALGTLVFFASYFSSFGKKLIKPIPFSILNMILFAFCYFWNKNNGAIIKIDSNYATGLFIAHILIVFGFSTTFLAILINYTVKLDNKIRKESETDNLTSIPNRNGLMKYINRIGEQKSNYVLAIFDIDDFKKFNDKNGHLCGDYVLQTIATIAKSNSEDDFVSRWGGEEFVVISKKCDTDEETYNKIERIRETVERNEFYYYSKKLKVTITIGVAQYETNFTLEQWISEADKKLYYGKHNGKNQVVK